MKMVAGTARSMGITVTGEAPFGLTIKQREFHSQLERYYLTKILVKMKAKKRKKQLTAKSKKGKSTHWTSRCSFGKK